MQTWPISRKCRWSADSQSPCSRLLVSSMADEHLFGHNSPCRMA